MSLSTDQCCVLSAGPGAWAFEPLATRLSSVLGIDISDKPRAFNYLLHVDSVEELSGVDTFVPVESIKMAADKRLIAAAFNANQVSTPRTFLCDTFEEARSVVREHHESEWCLKYPTSCGANGHRMLTLADEEPPRWPTAFVVQEFIRMESPEVFRTYGAGGELFGWVVRRFPEGAKTSSWVAHARGARYVILKEPPAAVIGIARQALEAAGLWRSFGCVDLLQRPSGEWVALEVGTDGLFNHVDRDLEDPNFEEEIYRRIATAFWKEADRRVQGRLVSPSKQL